MRLAVVEDHHDGGVWNGRDGDAAGDADDSGESLRAAKRQTIGRVAGRLARNGGGGDGTRIGGRNFVLRRVTLGSEVDAMDMGGRGGSGGGGNCGAQDVSRRSSAKVDIRVGDVVGSGGRQDAHQKNAVRKGGGGREEKRRSMEKSLDGVVNTEPRRSEKAASTKAAERHVHDGRQGDKRYAQRTSNTGGPENGSRRVAVPTRSTHDREQSQSLRDELLEYTTSQMASANLCSKPDAPPPQAHAKTTNSSRNDVTVSSYLAVPGTKHRSRAKVQSQKPIKPKNIPKNRNHEAVERTRNGDRLVPKGSKADLKAAAIMQAFDIDVTCGDAEGDNKNIKASENTTTEAMQQHRNSGSTQQQDSERSERERKFKRPGATAAEKAWRQRNWKRSSRHLLSSQNIPVLTLASEDVINANGNVIADAADSMDVDISESERCALQGMIVQRQARHEEGVDDDDDNSSTYDTYIREPKSNIKESDYDAVRVGYLAVDKSNVSRQNGRRRGSSHGDNISKYDYRNERDDASATSEDHRRRDHNAISDGNTFWSSVWDTWDAELELEARVEEELQLQLAQQQQHHHHHQEQQSQQLHQHHHPQQHHQYSQIHLHAIQQLREHIRARLLREYRRNGINTMYFYDDDDYYCGADDDEDFEIDGFGIGIGIGADGGVGGYSLGNGNGNGNGCGRGRGGGSGGVGDVDEEDENAEGYWGADYPDEDEGVDGDDSDELDGDGDDIGLGSDEDDGRAGSFDDDDDDDLNNLDIRGKG